MDIHVTPRTFDPLSSSRDARPSVTGYPPALGQPPRSAATTRALIELGRVLTTPAPAITVVPTKPTGKRTITAGLARYNAERAERRRQRLIREAFGRLSSAKLP